MIYLDYAATSWPKPPQVLAAMVDFLERAGGNPGRSGHRLSIAAGRVINDAREAVAACFGADDPLRVIFTPNVTYALNIALQALRSPATAWSPHRHQHNSVMRPLREMAKAGLDLVAPCDHTGALDLDVHGNWSRPARAWWWPTTPATWWAPSCRPARSLPSSPGPARCSCSTRPRRPACCSIDVVALGVDLFAFTGHKGLQGPPGTGGLILGERVDVDAMRPVFAGGTGSRSEREEQPEILPDKFEVGTPNGVGIAGLAAGVRYVMAHGIAAIRADELALTQQLCQGLAAIPGVRVYGLPDPARTATVSVTLAGRSVV